MKSILDNRANKDSRVWRRRQRSAVHFVEQGREVQYSVEDKAEKCSTVWRLGQISCSIV